MNKTIYLWLFMLLACVACGAPLGPIAPAVPVGQVQTRIPSPLPVLAVAETPSQTITPLPSAYAPTNATAAPPQAAGQITPPPVSPGFNAFVPDSVSLTLSPAQWLGSSIYQLSGPTQASVLAPGAVVRVKFFTAPTSTGMTPALGFTDTNGNDGWSWYWQIPRGGSHLWAEAAYRNGARASSPVLLILTEAPPPATWLNLVPCRKAM